MSLVEASLLAAFCWQPLLESLGRRCTHLGPGRFVMTDIGGVEADPRRCLAHLDQRSTGISRWRVQVYWPCPATDATYISCVELASSTVQSECTRRTKPG
jgi:hypothetical protein